MLSLTGNIRVPMHLLLKQSPATRLLRSLYHLLPHAMPLQLPGNPHSPSIGITVLLELYYGLQWLRLACWRTIC